MKKKIGEPSKYDAKYKLGNDEPAPEEFELVGEVMNNPWQSPADWEAEKAKLEAKLLEPIDHKLESREAIHEMVYLLVANGQTFKQVALETGLSAATVSKYATSEMGKARIKYHQSRMFGKQTRKRVESLAELAIQNMQQFLEDQKNDKIRYNATVYIMDQSIGKAKQSIEVQGNMLSEFMDRINSTREVVELGKELQKPADELDTFVNEVVQNHTVGVRNRGAKDT